jgi:polysaccharide export outer membrane protein
LDVLSAAGGTTPRAGRKITITHRNDAEHPAEVELSGDPSTALAPSNNLQIYPGDTVVVSRAGIVYVVGEVAHPAGFVMENNERMTALQAYAMAGGSTSFAKLGDTRVIRRTGTGLQEIRIPMKQMLEAKAEDVALQANDILYVPGSTGKKAARRTLDSIVQITTGLAIRY